MSSTAGAHASSGAKGIGGRKITSGGTTLKRPVTKKTIANGAKPKR